MCGKGRKKTHTHKHTFDITATTLRWGPHPQVLFCYFKATLDPTNQLCKPATRTYNTSKLRVCQRVFRFWSSLFGEPNALGMTIITERLTPFFVIHTHTHTHTLHNCHNPTVGSIPPGFGQASLVSPMHLVRLSPLNVKPHILYYTHTHYINCATLRWGPHLEVRSEAVVRPRLNGEPNTLGPALLTELDGFGHT